MRTRRSLLAAVVLSLVAAGCALEARAAITVETDYAGQYVRTVVVAASTLQRVRVWSSDGGLSSPNVLNPEGDRNGDLWPVIVENPYDGNRPWAAWSRATPEGFDLAWSRWAPGGWSATSRVETADDGATCDDLDPRIAFGPFGQPYLVWWRDEGGIGRVYFSLFLGDGWSRAEPVSDEGIDSRHPQITVLPDGRIQVEFETPGGHVVRFVCVVLPQSITDDIDPISPKGYVPPSNPTQQSVSSR